MEARKRIDKKIASASAALMSNTKWRKLFAVLREISPPVSGVQWKFINDERVFEAQIPQEDDLLEDSFGDIHPYPYGPYRDIEWIFIPAYFTDPRSDEKRPLPPIKNSLGTIRSAVEKAGHFPLEHLESGIKVVGYK